MERQTINIVIKTEGEKCQMTTEEITSWYENSIMNLFNKEYGTPIITVDVIRETI